MYYIKVSHIFKEALIIKVSFIKINLDLYRSDNFEFELQRIINHIYKITHLCRIIPVK